MDERYAPLSNMTGCKQLVQELQALPPHLPRMGGFYGPTGIGKSVAAAYTSAQTNAVFVRVTSTSTAKWLCEKLLLDLGEPRARGTLASLTDQVCDLLLDAGRPVIIDEADHVVTRRFVELFRDIHDRSEAVILFIGEEHLSDRMAEWERVHNRVKFVPASLPTAAEVLTLRDFYGRPDVRVADDLALHFCERCNNSLRRLAMNLHEATEVALKQGLAEIDLAKWGQRPVMTGRVDHVLRQVA